MGLKSPKKVKKEKGVSVDPAVPKLQPSKEIPKVPSSEHWPLLLKVKHFFIYLTNLYKVS